MVDDRDEIRSILSESDQGDRRENTGQVDLIPLAEQMRHAEKIGKRAGLLVLDGMAAGNTIPLDSEPIILGNSGEGTVCLSDDGISRQHARFELTASNELVVTDLNSTNGTFVRGNRISTATLQPGEKILLGPSTMLKFVIYDELDRLYQQELYSSSISDRLTGICNRKHIEQRLTSFLSYARRHRSCLSLLMFDVDHLKLVNHTYGRLAGDQVLVTLSCLASSMIREEDLLGRYDGGKFAVIAPGIDLNGGYKFGERIRLCIFQTSIQIPGHAHQSVQVTVSVGVATVLQNLFVSCDEVIDAAIANIDAAKSGGYNRVVASEISASSQPRR